MVMIYKIILLYSHMDTPIFADNKLIFASDLYTSMTLTMSGQRGFICILMSPRGGTIGKIIDNSQYGMC